MDSIILTWILHGVFEEQESCWETEYLLEWLKSEEPTIPSPDEDVEELELSYVAGGNAKSYSHFAKHCLWFLTKLNLYLTIRYSKSTLSFYPGKMKTYIHTQPAYLQV